MIFHGLLEMHSEDQQYEAVRLLAPSGEFLQCDEFAIRQTYQPSCLLLSWRVERDKYFVGVDV